MGCGASATAPRKEILPPPFENWKPSTSSVADFTIELDIQTSGYFTRNVTVTNPDSD